jgi:tetratricopeptide (TPR) repeat protein
VRGQTIGLATVGIVRCAMLGEIDAGLQSCRRAVELAPDPYSGFYAHMFLVRAAALAASLPGGAAQPSALDDSFRASKAALERHAADSLDPVWSADTLLALCEAELASKDTARAGEYAQRMLREAAPDGDPLMVAQGLCLLGRVEFALGQLEASRSRLSQALAQFDSIGARFHAAAAGFALADTALAQGDHVAAATYLAQSATTYTALGALFWSSLVRRVASEHASVSLGADCAKRMR